ncbi:MAG: CDP-glucose 4,6-dehydratase [Syntrophus sp. SKADARSKE-3]|nr:CDP-glucose 4,6-dehydratase [Syntrophus sp. SKADARSKE-3]
MFNDIYRNKRVLLTGHTGFKGGWLAIWLKVLGAEVLGYALDPPSSPNLWTVTALEDQIRHIHGDVRDYKTVESVFQDFRPEFVFHLAAQPLVRLSYEEPKTTFDTNVGGTVNVLEAVRQTPGVRVVVNVTSDKCYDNKEWIWGYRESDPLGGHDPYSASKGCAELVFQAYLKSFYAKAVPGITPIGAASVRAGNVIGGGDWGKDRLLPDCIRALSTNDPISVRNPRAVRPWQHVLEPLRGYLLLGSRLWERPDAYAGSWNFGPEGQSQLPVKDLVTRLIALWGHGTWEDLSDPSAPHEAHLLKLCCDKAHGELGWRGVLTIDECLAMTAAWYKTYYSEAGPGDMYRFCVEQIQRYEEKAVGAFCGCDRE